MTSKFYQSFIMPNKNLSQKFIIFGTTELVQLIKQASVKIKKTENVKTLTVGHPCQHPHCGDRGAHLRHGRRGSSSCSHAGPPPPFCRREDKKLALPPALPLPLTSPRNPNPSRPAPCPRPSRAPPPHRRRPELPQGKPSAPSSSPRRPRPPAASNRSREHGIEATVLVLSGTAAAVHLESPPSPSLADLAVNASGFRVSRATSWTPQSFSPPPRS